MYTKGPWILTELNIGINSSIIFGSHGELICDVYGCQSDVEDPVSNARLVSAAPDMLESLVSIRNAIKNIPVNQIPELAFVMQFVDPVIKKALGEK